MIKVIAFDFDGTLVDTTESIWREYERVIQEMGLEPVTYKEFTRQLGKPWDVALHALWPDLDVKDFSRKYRHEREKCQFFKGAIKVLEFLKESYKLALLTSRDGKSLTKILTNSDIPEDTFEVELDNDSLRAHKPDPKALKQLMDLLSLENDELVYVGDSVIDAECALNAKVSFIGVTSGGATRSEFKNSGVKHIIDKLEELPEKIKALA